MHPVHFVMQTDQKLKERKELNREQQVFEIEEVKAKSNSVKENIYSPMKDPRRHMG